MNTLKTAVGQARKAAGIALVNARNISSSETPELELYKKLTPVHFDAIAQVYGQEGLLRYIKTMESKALIGES